MKRWLLCLIGLNLLALIILCLVQYSPNRRYLDHNAMDSAAIAALDRINPVSIHQDYEYAGLVIARQDRYFTTQPTTDRSSHESHTPGWEGSMYAGYLVARYHTHGAMSPGYKNCEFSHQDTTKVNTYEYLATPCNTILKFDTRDRMVYRYDRLMGKWQSVRPNIWD